MCINYYFNPYSKLVLLLYLPQCVLIIILMSSSSAGLPWGWELCPNFSSDSQSNTWHIVYSILSTLTKG